jgi:hypothetical protein
MAKFQKFLADIRTNPVLRTNRFDFRAVSPTGAILDTVYAEQLSIPETNNMTLEFQIDSRPNVLIPYARNYGNNTIEITFREAIKSNEPHVYAYFLEWSELIVRSSAIDRKYEINYYDNIVGTGTIQVFDINESPIMSIDMLKIFPTSVKMSPFDWSEQNNYVKTTVTLAFEEFLF